MRFVRVCVLACVIVPPLPLATADARPRAPRLAAECNVSMNCDAPVHGTAVASRSDRKTLRQSRHRVTASSAANQALAWAPAAALPRELETRSAEGVSMAGVVPALAAKVAQIQSACPGAHVISAVRHTRIRGSRHMSLHATGEAVDMRGNPSCVYAQLRDWPGGYSTDYGRAQHIHISLAANGREAGLRFAHGGGRHHHHRHRRLASR
jgi:hypothetical protein